MSTCTEDPLIELVQRQAALLRQFERPYLGDKMQVVKLAPNSANWLTDDQWAARQCGDVEYRSR